MRSLCRPLRRLPVVQRRQAVRAWGGGDAKWEGALQPCGSHTRCRRLWNRLTGPVSAMGPSVVAGQIPHNPRCRLGSDTKAGPLRRQRVVPIGGSCRHSVSIKSRPGLPIELGAAENRRGEVEGGVFPGASFRQLGFGLHLGRQRRQDRRCPCLWFTVSRSVPAWAKRNGRQRYWQHESKRLGADETPVIFLNALAGRQRQPLAVGKAKEMWCWSRDGVRYAAETACPVGKVALLG